MHFALFYSRIISHLAIVRNNNVYSPSGLSLALQIAALERKKRRVEGLVEVYHNSFEMKDWL